MVGDADQLHVERVQARLDGRADLAVAEDHYGASGELARFARVPAVFALAIAQFWKPPRRGEDRREHPLGDGDIPGPAGVADPHAGRDVRQQPVDSRGDRLQHAQPWHLPQQLEQAAIARGVHEELRVENLPRQFAIMRDQA